MDPESAGERETASAVGDAPRRVSHYEILSEIGRGGMGVVYRARNLSLDLEVALKRPSRELAFHPRHLHRFTREARTLARLCHPNIVRVHDAFEVDGIPWVVLDLVDGISLREVLRGRDGPLPVPDVISHTIGLAGALQAAHAHRIVHRDVTPGNVLIGRDGTARLTDFGLARWYAPVDEDGEDSTTGLLSTQRGTVVGTPSYMSPEQIIGDRLDGRSDLFSLGVVAYEMATGRSPFRVEGEETVRHAILQREPDPLSRHNRDVPKEFERIVGKSLAKNREDRYQTAAEMLEDLRGAESTERTPIPPRRWVRRTWDVGTAVAAGALVTLVIWAIIAGLRPPWPPEFSSRHLTTDLGVESDPAVSPDGTFVAFTSNRAGNSDIWLVDVRGGEPRQLTFNPGQDRSPAWFPDGSALAFTTDRAGQSSIWRMPRLGGSALPLIADARDPAPAPDGKRIAFSSFGGDGQTHIAVASLNAPRTHEILTGEGDGTGDRRWPAWSPDGTRIAYCDDSDLWVMEIDGGGARRLTEGPDTETRPYWSPDGKRIYYSSGRVSTIALWAIPASGGKPQSLTPGTGPESSPTLSDSGEILAYTTFLRDSNLVVLDRHTGDRIRIGDTRIEGVPAVSPDGTAVVYTSDRAKTNDLWLQPLRVGRPSGSLRQLTDLPKSIAVPSFSPDGSMIAFGYGDEDEWDIGVIPVSGGVPVWITDLPGPELTPRWSPDMTRLTYIAQTDGHFQIWVARFKVDGKLEEATRVTSGSHDAILPVWSPDGTRIAYICKLPDGPEVCTIRVSDPGSETVVTAGARALYPRWDRDRLLVSGMWDTGQVHLRTVDPDSGASTRLDPDVTMGDDHAWGDFDLSADGRILVFDEDATRGDVWILQTRRGSF